MLWRDLKVFQIFGANTDVGKTIISTLLCRALQKRAPTSPLLYLKPVSTGPSSDADDRHVAQFAPGVLARCISQFSEPVSPHLAAKSYTGPPTPTTDKSILSQTKRLLSSHALDGGRHALVETAGGVLSPGPSGTPQAELYRPLKLPTILVGDSKLGGIATTISAFESLHLRGYDVELVALFNDPKWSNADYLSEHFKKYSIPTFSIPPPPSVNEDSAAEDAASLMSYYDDIGPGTEMTILVELLYRRHFERVSRLFAMHAEAESTIWHPFRQHQLPQDIIAIDSAYGDHFETYRTTTEEPSTARTGFSTPALQSLASSNSSKPLTTPLFDGSASWWTQGLGHGNPDLALTAAHAAGRYGHVMFANAVHQPALDISHTLLSTLANPRLNRVFFTDNGSTGMEVAVKMALRASSARYGWNKNEGEVGILGLSGSYHGDTIGVMNCSEPNVFNEKVDWHRPWGYWFDPPSVKMKKGKWYITLPETMHAQGLRINSQFSDLEDLFNFGARERAARLYEGYIKSALDRLVRNQNRRFGALIMEPIVMGAGGMIFVDPLFQRTLIRTIRSDPTLIKPGYQSDQLAGSNDWKGLPVIADEVFTGLYRLGRASSSSLLSSNPLQNKIDGDIAPDISVHAKLLTGGLLPLAITTASESIFKTFLSDKKQDALLHGHSYTAHAIGCAVADKSLKDAKTLSEGPVWTAHKKAWLLNDRRPDPAVADPPPGPLFSFFAPTFLAALSEHERVAGCFALGTVLAMTLASPDAAGYTSTAAAALQRRLLDDVVDDEGEGGGAAAGIHSRVLGDVLYVMTSLTTTPEAVRRIQRAILRALD